MTVKDILEKLPVYANVNIHHEDKKFVVSGQVSKLLESADFLMMRKVELIEIDGSNFVPKWFAITLSAEE